MPRWTTSDRARIAFRRRAVELLSNQGLGLYEIIDRLSADGVVNPDTEEPYSVATISRDLHENTRQWMAEIVKERGLHKGRQLAELREARRKAWVNGDLAEVRMNLQTEIKLLGTDSPIRLEIDWRQEARELGLDPATVFEQYVEAAAAAISSSTSPKDSDGFNKRFLKIPVRPTRLRRSSTRIRSRIVSILMFKSFAIILALSSVTRYSLWPTSVGSMKSNFLLIPGTRFSLS